jgi:choline-sulfatase
VTSRPNVLLIMADQLAAGCLSAYGHPLVHAPNLAALAASGTVFESAYCASPLCAPSRSAMLTGRRPSRIGVYDNAAELRADTPTIAHALRAAGYRTTLSGKMHFVGPDQLHGFEERLTTDVYPAGYEWTPDWRDGAHQHLPWYHNMASLRQTAVVESAMQTDYDDEVCFRAVQALRDRARSGDERPFFLVASFTNPHDPWEVRERHWKLYEGVALPPPRVPPIPRDRADPFSLRLRDMYEVDTDPLSAGDRERAVRGYLAAISYLDERVGELLSALRDTGAAGSTIVLFTADHGEMLGERGLWYKMAFFEGSARVPLIAAGPGVAAARVATPVSQLDLLPTLAELCGASLDGHDPDGCSIAAALAGEAAPPRPVVGEYLAEGVAAPAAMVRDGSLKLIRCPGDPDQLYDLAQDPLELENAAADPARAGDLERLGAVLDASWEVDAVRRDVLASQARRRAVWRALATGAHTPWDHQPWTDASRQFVRSATAGAPRPWHGRPGGALPS